jgi:hypothetical protein
LSVFFDGGEPQEGEKVIPGTHRNYEVHFTGPGTPELPCLRPTDSCLFQAQKERDADSFTEWATEGAANTLSNGVTALSVQQSDDPLKIQRGGTIESALVITANSWVGFSEPVYNDEAASRYEAPAPNIAVEFECGSASGLSIVVYSQLEAACSSGQKLCVVMTGPGGTAAVGLHSDAAAPLGNSTVKVRFRNLVPGGASEGEVVERTVTVEVVP